MYLTECGRRSVLSIRENTNSGYAILKHISFALLQSGGIAVCVWDYSLEEAVHSVLSPNVVACMRMPETNSSSSIGEKAAR
jgi:hypothetical protein